MHKEPSQEQIKEFWEWCGLHYYPECECINGKGCCWGESEETYGKNGHWHFVFPYVDLNNLFEWAVPKIANGKGRDVLDILLCDWVHSIKYNLNDPALALFWAIYKVMDFGVNLMEGK